MKRRLKKNKVTDLEKFALEQVVRPYQNMKFDQDRPFVRLPCSLHKLAVMLDENDKWAICVKDRIRRIGFWFPSYIDNFFVTIIRRYNESML